MSEHEKPKSFMQELDAWTEATVIMPLAGTDQSGEWDATVDGVKKAIREKVLQSYRNGLKAQAKPASQNFVNRVVNADCLAVLPELPDSSVDFILTDPPYITGYRDRLGRTVANDDRTGWLRPAFAELYRVLKNNRFCVSFYGWPKVDLFFAAWRRVGFYPVAHLVWPKSYTSRKRFVGYQHEQAFVLAKGRPERPATVIGDVLPWQYTENRLHPTQKPVSGLLLVVDAFSRRGDVVLDPFCGSGSTLVAAQQLGRRYIGVEMDSGYATAAQRRMSGREVLPLTA